MLQLVHAHAIRSDTTAFRLRGPNNTTERSLHNRQGLLNVYTCQTVSLDIRVGTSVLGLAIYTGIKDR